MHAVRSREVRACAERSVPLAFTDPLAPIELAFMLDRTVMRSPEAGALQVLMDRGGHQRILLRQHLVVQRRVRVAQRLDTIVDRVCHLRRLVPVQRLQRTLETFDISTLGNLFDQGGVTRSCLLQERRLLGGYGFWVWGTPQHLAQCLGQVLGRRWCRLRHLLRLVVLLSDRLRSALDDVGQVVVGLGHVDDPTLGCCEVHQLVAEFWVQHVCITLQLLHTGLDVLDHGFLGRRHLGLSPTMLERGYTGIQ